MNVRNEFSRREVALFSYPGATSRLLMRSSQPVSLGTRTSSIAGGPCRIVSIWSRDDVDPVRNEMHFPTAKWRAAAASALVLAASCQHLPPVPPNGRRPVTPVSNDVRMELSADPLRSATQLVVVTTPGWDSTSGELRKFSRETPYAAWRDEGPAVPVVVGRTGLAWGVGFDTAAVTGEPHKKEGDGRSPAGIFPIDTAFGFDPPDIRHPIAFPYVTLTGNTECVDDTASVHYNTVVDRSAVPAVDWNSSEHMRKVAQYRIGLIIGYNAAPPVKARGSCIFFHIWNGPQSTTVGCTAMDSVELARMMKWFRRETDPMVVQVPRSVYTRVRSPLNLPFLDSSD